MSYAHNGEDVRLARAFEGRNTGFYVDVGAHDPVIFSITKHFYDRGWHGLNIDADEDAADRIREARPRDVTVNVGVSNQPGSLTFYRAGRNAAGLNSFSSEEVARHRASGFRFSERSVAVTTLAQLASEHVREPIDFMTIDVEGFEREVLEGADFQRYRPKIVLVESTRPLSREQSHDRWEALLFAASYRYVVFDGVNRYYVAEEHAELGPPLEAPPNPLDDFISYEHQRKIDALQKKLDDQRLPIRIARGMVTATDAVYRLISGRDR